MLQVLLKDYPLYSQDKKDPLVLARLFDICGSGTWFLTEYCPNTETAFGFCTGLDFDELGYTSIRELEALTHLGIPRIEVDQNVQLPRPMSELVPHPQFRE